MLIPIRDLGRISRFVLVVLFVGAGRSDLAILYALLLIYHRLDSKFGAEKPSMPTFVSNPNLKKDDH
jgi:fructoselysine-6-P-deglycase FrlB-like protein